MAAKGSTTKEQMLNKLLEVFPDSFRNEKEVRVNVIEDGNPIQIKITLTMVKTPLSNNPENQIINEVEYFISDDEKEDLKNTLKEIGVSF